MDLGLIFGIVLVLLILTFGTLTIVFSLKSWHWLHITSFCLLLVTLPAAMYYMAAYARTTAAWGNVFNDLESKLTKEKADNLKNNVGDPPMSAKPANPGIVQLVSALDRLMMQRGRVWRSCTATPFVAGANNTVVSKVTTLRPNTPPAEVAKNKNGIVPQTEVFIFKETVDAANALSGYLYLGRFGVVASSETDIDVTPYDYLTPQQVALFAPGSYFTVYEALPTDDNSVFEDLGTAEQRTAEIEKVLAPFGPNGALASGLTQEAYDALVKSFTRHGGDTLETDRPEEIWTKIKFIEDHSEQVDAATVTGIDTQLFDSSGRAIRGTLQRGDVVKFKKGDEVTLDKAAADELIRNGKAEKVADVYRRLERDFDTGFRLLNKQAIDINSEIQKVQRNIASMQETIKKLDSEIAYRTTEKAALTEDLTNFENDAKVMARLSSELTATHGKLLDRLSEVYRKNQEMLAKIAEIDAKLTEQIDQKVQTAKTP
jgi:hypothetical protein